MNAQGPRTSIVFAVVAAMGSPLESFLEPFSRLLPIPIRLTDLLSKHVAEPGSATWSNEGDRVQNLMNAGDDFRKQTGRLDAMALLATLGIRDERARCAPAKSYAFVIRQLKHPDEISTLRQVYGDRLFVLALYSTYTERLKHLTKVLKVKRTFAEALIKRDQEDEYTEWGQRTRDAFELGDVFLRIDEPNCNHAMIEAERFLDLVFGNPELSPKAHEHAMYLAYAASLRSADLSRQVGAVVTTSYGDIVSVGANDVPCSGRWPVLARQSRST